MRVDASYALKCLRVATGPGSSVTGLGVSVLTSGSGPSLAVRLVSSGVAVVAASMCVSS